MDRRQRQWFYIQDGCKLTICKLRKVYLSVHEGLSYACLPTLTQKASEQEERETRVDGSIERCRRLLRSTK